MGSNRRQTSKSQYPILSTGQVGAISEMRVCGDLLAKGYEVFRSVSAAATCDLIALKGGRCLRIEVRTSFYHGNNGEFYVGKKARDEGRQDHFAAVLPDQIVYSPPLP